MGDTRKQTLTIRDAKTTKRSAECGWAGAGGDQLAFNIHLPCHAHDQVTIREGGREGGARPGEQKRASRSEGCEAWPEWSRRQPAPGPELGQPLTTLYRRSSQCRSGLVHSGWQCGRAPAGHPWGQGRPGKETTHPQPEPPLLLSGPAKTTRRNQG